MSMGRTTVTGLCICLLVNLNQAANASPDECREVISEFNLAVNEISSTLKRYTTCISDSQGHDDCSIQFKRLKSAQGDFENAVARYETECN